MEIDFEWYSQDNEYNQVTNPIDVSTQTPNTIWNVVKTDNNSENNDINNLSDSFYKNINLSNIFNSYDNISWNVVKEDSIKPSSVNIFNNDLENPFITNIDSNIFSSFSWGDILTENIDDSFTNNDNIFKYERIPSDESSISIIADFPEYSSFPIIQEDSGDDEDLESNSVLSEDLDSWIYVPEEKNNTKLKIGDEIGNKIDDEICDEICDEPSSCVYSFNFDSSITSEDNQSINTPEYTYTATQCDEISLDSSISSEEPIEEDMNVVSFSMPSLPSLQISFDDRKFTFYDENISKPSSNPVHVLQPSPSPSPLPPMKSAY